MQPAALLQALPLGAAQVEVVALHWPLRQAAFVALDEQVSCRPSVGSGLPFASLVEQASVLRLQNWPLPQSLST